MNCGLPVAENAKFCSSCGLAFTQELAAVSLTSIPGLTRADVTPNSNPGILTPDEPSSDTTFDKLKAALADRYLIEKELGRGGMATVYLAKDVKHDRDVAIKVLLPELSASIGGERFEREIKLAAKLQHPHILGLFDSGEAVGLLYYVMPFVKGESVRDKLDRESQLSVDDAILITLEVADALSHAHAQGIVHRDIKPENIMLSGGHALVADFGIARAATEAGAQKLTQTGMAVGTPVYMSPEQAGGEEVGPAADIYSLGCVLYEMLAGEPPFTGKSPMAIMARHAMEQVPSIRIVRSSVPEEVEAAIFAAMGKVPADRPQTAQAFAEILGMPMGSTASMRVMGGTATRRIPSGAQAAYGRTQAFGVAAQPVWWRRPVVLAAAALIVAGGGFGAWYAAGRGRSLAAASPDARRVAVLYFEDETKDKSLGPLADGLTEGLIQSLSNAASITVISRSGVEGFRGSALAIDSIARALRAGYLVRGQVDREGNNVRVNVFLDDGSGARIDKQSFAKPAGNLLAMRDTLALVASDLIKKSLKEDIQVRTERASTSNQDAWLLLQRGEQARKNVDAVVAKGDTAAIDGAIHAADSLLALAERADGKWAEPITRRALLAYRRSRTVGRDPGAIRKWVEMGLGHANRALALDPNSADALELRGTLTYFSWVSNLESDASRKQALLVQARADLEKSATLNPKQAGAWAALVSLYYQVPGVTTTDIYLAADKAYSADEFAANAPLVLHRLFTAAYDLNSSDKAELHCKVFGSRFPADARAKRCRLFVLTLPKNTSPNIAEAWRIADSVVAMTAPPRQALERFNVDLLVAAALAGASKTKPELADSARHVAKRSAGDVAIDATRDLSFYAARVYTILGDKADAIRLLKEYFAANPQRAISFRDDPGWWFKDIADDPAFKQLVGAVK